MCVFQTEQQAQRTLLIQGSESLDNVTQSIARSQRIAVESEHIGTDIIEELGQQREQLDRTRDRVRHSNIIKHHHRTRIYKHILHINSSFTRSISINTEVLTVNIVCRILLTIIIFIDVMIIIYILLYAYRY